MLAGHVMHTLASSSNKFHAFSCMYFGYSFSSWLTHVVCKSDQLVLLLASIIAITHSLSAFLNDCPSNHGRELQTYYVYVRDDPSVIRSGRKFRLAWMSRDRLYTSLCKMNFMGLNPHVPLQSYHAWLTWGNNRHDRRNRHFNQVNQVN